MAVRGRLTPRWHRGSLCAGRRSRGCRTPGALVSRLPGTGLTRPRGGGAPAALPWAAETWARPGVARRGSPRPRQARGPPVLQAAAALRSGGPHAGTSGPPRHRGATARESRGQVSRFKLTPSSESPLRWGRPHRGRSHSSCHPCPPRGTWSRRRPPGRRGRPCREAPASDTHVRPRADPFYSFSFP